MVATIRFSQRRPERRAVDGFVHCGEQEDDEDALHGQQQRP